MVVPAIPFWRKIPALRLLVPLILGILLQWHLPIAPAILWPALGITSILLWLFACLPNFQKFRWAYAAGFLFMKLIFLAACLSTYYADIRHHPRWLGHQDITAPLLVSVLESPQPREKTWKTVVQILETTSASGARVSSRGKLLLYFQRNVLDSTRASILQPGSMLLILSKPELIQEPSNPGQFDYKRYCLFEGITHQVFLRDTQFIILSHTRPEPMRKLLESIRQHVIGIIRKNIKDPEAAGLAEALLIGYKNDLDKSLLQLYANTGVVHIIAISGLHLGLIYWILKWLSRWLPKKGRLRWWRLVIILSGLWLFSLLAGAQPSIVRSAVMFSFIVLAESMSRRSNIYNSLACSAFLLLAYHPFWLWDIGFQLSYAAVLSLVLYMQPIYRLFYIPVKWLDQLWKMNAVTLSAQVLTIPLCLYHFHQFPNYFLLANLLCVPLSSAILMGEILLCGISPFPIAAAYLGWLIEKSILLMNGIVRSISQLPYAISKGIPMNEWQAFAWYGLLIGLMSLLLWRYRWGGKLILFSLLTVFIMRYWQRQSDLRRIEWRVYNLPGQTASDFILGRDYQSWDAESVERKSSSYLFHLEAARVGIRGRKVNQLKNLIAHPSSLFFAGRKILVLQQPLRKPIPLKADILWLQKGSKLMQPALLADRTINQIVADASLNAWETHKWKEAAERYGIPFHDVKTDAVFALRCR